MCTKLQVYMYDARYNRIGLLSTVEVIKRVDGEHPIERGRQSSNRRDRKDESKDGRKRKQEEDSRSWNN